MADVAWKYPCSLSVIQESLGLIAHSLNSLRVAEQWFAGDTSDWEVIPLTRATGIGADKIGARQALGLTTEDFLVCAFGILGPHKLSHRLLQAWLRSSLARARGCRLIFVGENPTGDYGQELIEVIRGSQAAENVRITGWVDKSVYRQYLAAADVGVQLRTLSRGETSAAVLDCMNYGLATIVNANGSMADLDEEAVWKLPDGFADEQLIGALETIWRDEALRHRMGVAARSIILRDHHPRVCADQFGEAIERCYRSAASGLHALPAAIAGIEAQVPTEPELILLAEAISRGFAPPSRKRQLLVDVSELVRRDSKSGIQRVVHGVLREWLENPPAWLRVEPVYATIDERGYRYARGFTLGYLDCPVDLLEDEPIDCTVGDVFLGLDLQPEVVPAQQAVFRRLRQQGVSVKFLVYDLLPVALPETCGPGVPEQWLKWLYVVAQCDGAICISRAVADELNTWVQANAPDRYTRFAIDWFHLGAGEISSPPTHGLRPDAEAVLSAILARISFLMVGTIEPRKGHAVVLEAFNQLWQSGHELNLVIVGKQGWMVDAFLEQLRSHAEYNKRLFWLEGISDEYLESVYAASTCLIAASYGEGFGLPLIEAAQHRLPIVARDIRVFREVAGEHAFYFSGTSPEDLACALQRWLALYEAGRHPVSDRMPRLTWEQSARQLLQIVLGGDAGRTCKTQNDTVDQGS